MEETLEDLMESIPLSLAKEQNTQPTNSTNHIIQQNLEDPASEEDTKATKGCPTLSPKVGHHNGTKAIGNQHTETNPPIGTIETAISENTTIGIGPEIQLT